MFFFNSCATGEIGKVGDGIRSSVTQYYGCREEDIPLGRCDTGATTHGYFRFGRSVCYGSCTGRTAQLEPGGALFDSAEEVMIQGGKVYLPFDPDEIVENLRHEAHAEDWRQGSSSTLASLYYFFRPIFPVGFRRHLQRFHFRGWEKLAFPQWPVDCSIESLFEQVMLQSLRATGAQCIPFIWFWPGSSSSCAIMTHDIETGAGRDFCPQLMDIDDAFGIKASFQVIPEERYEVKPEFLELLRRRDFEVVIHDLNHDGHLYRNREQFLERAKKINAYGKEYGAKGFRAGVLYRKQIWFDALDFEYEMSVPNVAHLDPQPGGCCTVMPYFVGDVLEIPVTTIQDYTLFNILSDYSINIWKRQTEIILEKHGLMSFILHPDYMMKQRERRVCSELLEHLATLKRDNRVWITTPGEVNRWWRQRAEMKLVEDGPGWAIEGPGSERARVAYAIEVDGQLVLTLDEPNERYCVTMRSDLAPAKSPTNGPITD